MDNVQRTSGCCSAEEAPRGFQDKVELGGRRRTLLIRVAAGASTVLCVAAVVVSVPAVSAPAALADRLAWGAAVWGAPLLLTYLRELLATRRFTPRLAVAVLVLVVGVLGLPLVAAVVVAVALLVRSLRPARGTTSPPVPGLVVPGRVAG